MDENCDGTCERVPGWRFTQTVMVEAADRYNGAKDEASAEHGEKEDAGVALLQGLGWDLDVLNEYAENTIKQLIQGFALDLGPRGVAALRTAIMDNVTFGAVCSDVTHDAAKSFAEKLGL